MILYLDPGETFPEKRMNYHKCAASIRKQTESGRKSFLSILYTNLTETDKAHLNQLIDNEYEDTSRAGRRTKSLAAAQT